MLKNKLMFSANINMGENNVENVESIITGTVNIHLKINSPNKLKDSLK